MLGNAGQCFRVVPFQTANRMAYPILSDHDQQNIIAPHRG